MVWETFRSSVQMLVLALWTFRTVHPGKVFAGITIVSTVAIIHDMLFLARWLTRVTHELFVVTARVTLCIGGRGAIPFVTQ